MEYAGGGELLDKVEEKGSLNELDARDIFRQIANAISYWHNRGLIHRDLKLENVLLKEKGSLTIKIVDFGIAGVCKNQQKDKTDSGTIAYMTPEVLSRTDTNAGPALDIWALGWMLYIMVIGNMPFIGDTEDELIHRIWKKKVSFKGTKPTSKEFKDLINKVLAKDPEDRISMFEMQNHPWMDMFDEDLEKSIEDSQKESEEEKKGDEEDDDDYLKTLSQKDKSPLYSDIESIGRKLGDVSLNKKYRSPSPRASPRNGGKGKKVKSKNIKKKKPKTTK